MSYELSPLVSWLLVASFLVLVAVAVIGSWTISTEIGYDKGFKSGYKRGLEDTRQYNDKRLKQLITDNDYLMKKIVVLKEQNQEDREGFDLVLDHYASLGKFADAPQGLKDLHEMAESLMNKAKK